MQPQPNTEDKKIQVLKDVRYAFTASPYLEAKVVTKGGALYGGFASDSNNLIN